MEYPHMDTYTRLMQIFGFLILVPQILMMGFMLFDASSHIYLAVYFYDNHWHIADSLLFAILGTSVIYVSLWSYFMRPLIKLTMLLSAFLINGVLGIYSPFVLIATILGISDAGLFGSALLTVYKIGLSSKIIPPKKK
ncbi:MAG: hypothetical protein QXL94_00045 [Candidatus Parvarchaeum sp.]